MKLYRFSKISLLSILFAFSGIVFTSCEKTEFEAKPIDEGQFEVSQEQMGYITDADGRMGQTTFEIKASGSADVNLLIKATKPSGTASEVTLRYDEEVLKNYNQETENEFAAFPSDNVLLDAGGVIALPENTQKSGYVKVSFTATDDMEAGKTYIIPIRAEITSGPLKLAGTGSSYLIVVKILESLGDNFKGENAVKLFSVIETNDTNPLNHLCFTLKDSKKYLFDYVVFFSDNVVIDSETGAVRALHNQQIVNLLNNKEKYVKPLQDRGMKVILGLMADHTHASVCNMKPETAQAFARYMKNVCDTYGLDGIFYDDEWDERETPTPPGFFAEKSVEAGARLMYEMKRIMPDKINIVYALGKFFDMSSEGCTFDGNTINDYIDFVMEDYSYTEPFNYETQFPGMPISKRGMLSPNFNRGTWRTDEQLEDIKAKGACHFIYAMSPFRESFKTPWKGGQYNEQGSTQLIELNRIAKVFYGEEIVYDEKPYSVDYK